MKGKILDFNSVSAEGVIAAEDGKRYHFVGGEWKSEGAARAGLLVDFVVDGESAQQLYLDKTIAPVSSRKIAAALLAFFFGGLGAHKFYLGYNKQGIIMLLTFLFGFILLGLPSMAIAIIAFIEFILYITKSDDDFEQSYIVGRRPWF
ncbi:TM2 domain-containing protein [Zhongshania arctica]|uniref:TM2 domain-containing protein n=1 Tax=Zhongshania arctica TaxID=3238302 RepID=A0ABV3TVC8_9GAMM|tara:strand:- start:5838 stop:6281 length:444 start_codon:yes stop_codon:yes gene_type:complete